MDDSNDGQSEGAAERSVIGMIDGISESSTVGLEYGTMLGESEITNVGFSMSKTWKSAWRI